MHTETKQLKKINEAKWLLSMFIKMARRGKNREIKKNEKKKRKKARK